jgi:hypothetical protein
VSTNKPTRRWAPRKVAMDSPCRLGVGLGMGHSVRTAYRLDGPVLGHAATTTRDAGWGKTGAPGDISGLGCPDRRIDGRYNTCRSLPNRYVTPDVRRDFLTPRAWIRYSERSSTWRPLLKGARVGSRRITPETASWLTMPASALMHSSMCPRASDRKSGGIFFRANAYRVRIPPSCWRWHRAASHAATITRTI